MLYMHFHLVLLDPDPALVCRAVPGKGSSHLLWAYLRYLSLIDVKATFTA